jgi:4-oxalocrotonate tautomerase
VIQEEFIMPFIRIDTIAGQYDRQQLSAISDVLYESVLGIGALENDRFQVFTQHAPEDLAFNPKYLSIPRTAGFVAIQIALVEGRSVEQKQKLYAFIADTLKARVGVRPEDVFVNLVEVAKENWSFGNGVAQYAGRS